MRDWLCVHSAGTWNPFLGLSNLKRVVRQTRSKEALADQLCPSLSKQPWRRGPSAPACGPGPAASARSRRGRARWGGPSGDRLSLSRCSSPGNTLQLHLFRVACLTEHPKQFQGYISLSHSFARGVSQARKWVGLLLFALRYTHTHTHTHTCPEHTQRTSKNTHVMGTQTQAP